jgi:hypothetical protein
MSSSDLLLLRSFKDDVKFVARKTSNNLLLLPFSIYSWSYTFEELIVKRLQYLGRVRLIDMEYTKGQVSEPKWSTSFSSRLRKWLSFIAPTMSIKLPPQGGLRHYMPDDLDEQEWQKEVELAMCTARIIVVVLGTTKSLNWEMKRIEELQLLKKTVFLMPPLVLKKNFRARWQQLNEFLTERCGYDVTALGRVNPKRVLAVCVRESDVVVITAKRTTQLFYESALDVAVLLTVAPPVQSGRMIRKYLA